MARRLVLQDPHAGNLTVNIGADEECTRIVANVCERPLFLKSTSTAAADQNLISIGEPSIGSVLS